MAVETDSHGRLYLSAELRERYGEKFHVVECEDRLELVPIEEDPLRAVRDEIGDALNGASRETLRGDARRRASDEVRGELERTGKSEGNAE